MPTESSVFIDIVNTPIDLAQGFKFISSPQQGAIASFIGTVREYNLGKQVMGVSYDVHKDLALNVLNKICQNNLKKYGNILRQFVVHYHGRLQVGETSVVIIVSTPHRKEAFAACQYIIESIKHEAPIWKQEHYKNGSSEWVQGHALCQH